MKSLALPENWDELVAEMGAHFYQTSTWAKFQQSLGREVYVDSGDGWAWLAALRHGRGGINYLYASYGPTVSSPLLVASSLESIKAKGQELGADFVRMEPMGNVTAKELTKLGLVRFDEVQPEHYLELDISPAEDELKKNISQSNRNLINQAETRGLSFRISIDLNDIDRFNLIHHATAKAGGFVLQPDDYFRKLVEMLLETEVGRLYFVDHEGETVAAAICFDWNGTRYYAFAGADPERNRELKAAIALVWWLIVDAKKQGLVRFNYGGVAPENQPNHPWAGHSRFKRSIGGETISTLGTWDLPLKPVKYRLYQLSKKILH